MFKNIIALFALGLFAISADAAPKTLFSIGSKKFSPSQAFFNNTKALDDVPMPPPLQPVRFARAIVKFTGEIVTRSEGGNFRLELRPLCSAEMMLPVFESPLDGNSFSWNQAEVRCTGSLPRSGTIEIVTYGAIMFTPDWFDGQAPYPGHELKHFGAHSFASRLAETPQDPNFPELPIFGISNASTRDLTLQSLILNIPAQGVFSVKGPTGVDYQESVSTQIEFIDAGVNH